MKYRLILFLTLVSPVLLSGQTVNEVFEKIHKKFTAGSFQFNTKYNLYKDANTKVIHQSYNGVFQKSSSMDMYMKIDKTEMINTSKYAIKINHTEKAMMVSKGQAFTAGQFDVSKLLAYCTINSFKDYKVYWEIILLTKQYTNFEYSKIVLYVNKDYTIRKQVFYYNTGINFSEDIRKQDFSNPRLEIEHSNHNNKEVNASIFNSSNFFTVNKGNKLLPSVKYKNYEIEDYRSN